MRRTPLLTALAVAATTLATPHALTAHADRGADRHADRRADNAAASAAGSAAGQVIAVGVRPMRLACHPRVADVAADVDAATHAVVRCRWSAIDAPPAAGVLLWRIDATVDHRQVIFRSDDPTITSYTDAKVRRGRRYTYAVQVVDAAGRVIAQSPAVTVFVPRPDDPSIEALRLRCELGPQHEAVACEWSPPTSPRAEVVELWRSVDGATRELVERFRPNGETTYRDRVPDGATRIAYAVLAKDADGRLVGRSRVEIVRIPTEQPTPQPETAAPTTITPTTVAPPTDAPPSTVTPPSTEPPSTPPPTTQQPPATQPVDTRPVDTRPVDTRPVDPPATTVDTRPRERVSP